MCHVLWNLKTINFADRIYMLHVILTKRQVVPLNNINRLAFLIETNFVFSEVGHEFLNIIEMKLKPKLLLCNSNRRLPVHCFALCAVQILKTTKVREIQYFLVCWSADHKSVSISKILWLTITTQILLIFFCLQANNERVSKFQITTACFSCSQTQWPRRLRSLEHWDLGFESHLRHGWLSTFILCLCLPVYVAALRRADNRPRSPTDCLRIKTLKWNERFTDALCSKWEQQE
jgi:hypothetical protein